MNFAFAIVVATIFVAFVSATPPPKCPAENGEDVVLYPNLDDCTTYYSCNEGEAFLMKCFEGLHYNAELRVCDYPENANCLPSTSSPSRPPVPNSSRVPPVSKPPRTTSSPSVGCVSES